MDRIIQNTKKNIIRNKWLSFATILVITTVFTISTLVIGTGFIVKHAVAYYEQRAQVIVFFKQETPESEIFKFRDAINDPNLIQSVEYTSKEQALAIYKQDFENDPDLVDTITADTLPPSLGVRAKTIQSLEEVIKKINDEKAKNAYVDEVLYFKNIVDTIKTLSKIINYGAVVLIIILLVISTSLITITISMNILAHKSEIEIMHLVGGTDKFIKTPYILEGAAYGLIGSFIAASIIIIPWYIMIYSIRGTDLHFWIGQILTDLNLNYLKSLNIVFLPLYYIIHLLLGLTLGATSSYFAVVKYLNLHNKA